MADYFLQSLLPAKNTDGIPSLDKDPLPDMPSIQVNSQGIQHLLSNPTNQVVLTVCQLVF